MPELKYKDRHEAVSNEFSEIGSQLKHTFAMVLAHDKLCEATLADCRVVLSQVADGDTGELTTELIGELIARIDDLLADPYKQ
jgi:hypothetical protein